MATLQEGGGEMGRANTSNTSNTHCQGKQKCIMAVSCPTAMSNRIRRLMYVLLYDSSDTKN